MDGIEGIIWLAILIIMVIIEIITLGLSTIWFAGGALVAFLASLVGASIPIQIALFLVVSFLLLAVTRPIAVKYFNKDRARTNAESLIGAVAVVQETIDNLQATGRVQVHGQEWAARSGNDMRIEPGTEVLVEEIHGVKLIVKEKGEV